MILEAELLWSLWSLFTILSTYLVVFRDITRATKPYVDLDFEKWFVSMAGRCRNSPPPLTPLFVEFSQGKWEELVEKSF